ncbi:glycosyltransferase involved in cell wall biosynthesis [Planomicrobium koreense]|uniref:Glycosyltransferase involved in cell wall biosynthesis n=1 Tax=Planococcus koreensis TaxID=112331 RepID=A0A7W8CT29_9BACL|nr:glycosyltransferase family 4 protein [Planococcus koreensis]MBB5179973.1 glycosyltransferase involved in cell wall biosynthesis [Planococcus koreensis]
MNEFIQFRNQVYDTERNDIYPLQFLDAYIHKSETMNSDERRWKGQIRTIKQLEQEKKLGEKEIDELLSFLGEHPSIDRLIVDAVLKLFNDETKGIVENKTKELLVKQQYDSQQLYHVLDICIECGLDVLSDDDIFFMLQKYKRDAEIMSVLLDYMGRFNRQGFKEHLYELLTFDYPDSIKIQAINAMRNLYSMEAVDQSFVKKNVINENNNVFFEGFMDFLHNGFKFENPGTSILQSMFYGDFEDSGKGNNGGLAVLLKGLGEEIAKDNSVSYVFTLTITQDLTKPFISFYGAKHVLIRLPIYLDQAVRDKFIKRELFIKRQIAHFLKLANLKPDVFHIRFLDNASKAVAHLCKELNRKLVFTLTPDPHRNMFDGAGQLKELDFNELIEKLNKIKIGDELIDISDGIVGIGNAEVKTELAVYFPQFKNEHVNGKINMIGEGIQIEQLMNAEDLAIPSNRLMEWVETNNDFFEKPVILNVGRLSVLKGQVELLKAWSNSRLSETHNLLLIGGDLERPNQEEEAVIDFFKDHVHRHPEFKGRFLHQGAMSNADIRMLEKTIIQQDFDDPHIYICSSVKEEFGIAILEAMSIGFLTLGPLKGGVKSYMRNGENGFLIDTSNWETIAKDAEKYLYDSKIDKDEVKKIQAAGQKTIDEHFSIKKISAEFVSMYLSVKGEEDHEI